MLNKKTKNQLKIDEFIPKIFIRNPNQNNLTKQQIFLINKEAEYFYSIVANLIDVLAVDMANKDPMASYRAKKAMYNHVISKEQLLDDSDQNFIDEILNDANQFHENNGNSEIVSSNTPAEFDLYVALEKFNLIQDIMLLYFIDEMDDNK